MDNAEDFLALGRLLAPEGSDVFCVYLGLHVVQMIHQNLIPGEMENGSAKSIMTGRRINVSCTVRDIMGKVGDLKIGRGGVIFYTTIDDRVFFCFGIDSKTQDLSDFGGRREDSENILETAIREANEESRKAIVDLTLDKIQDCRCIYNNEMLIVFVKCEGNIIAESISRFRNRSNITEDEKERKEFDEMTDLVWLTPEEIRPLLVRTKALSCRMYSKVRKCLSSNAEFMKIVNTPHCTMEYSVLSEETLTV